MSLAQLAIISNPFDPEIVRFNFPEGKAIGYLIGEKKPDYLFLNGEEFEDLDYIPIDGDVVSVYVEPGTGIELVYWIVLAVVAALAIYAYTQIPDDPDPNDGSNTYSLRGSSNIARLGKPVPIQYGEMRVFPDLISQPWIEYRSNEQYLHQVLNIGKGEFDISDIRISDTPVASFDDITTEVLFEGPVTLFPSDVENSVEVANQTLSTTNTGPFVANSSGTDINRIAVDVSFSTGVYRARSSGDIEALTAIGNVTIEYREIDDAGVPVGLGTWLTGANALLSNRSLSPLRTTYQFVVSPDGRYEVRVRRTVNENSLQQQVHDHLIWEGMRGFITDPTTYPNTTLLAVRVRATEQISNLSARSFNVFAQRKLPIFSSGSWQAPALTRDPAWAIADVLRNTDYGAGRPDSEMDTASFEAFATSNATNSFNYDGRFDVLTNIWKAIEEIAAVGKAFVVPSFNQLGVVIEIAQSLPAWTFNRANMRNERFQLTYDRSDDYDSVESRYFDEDEDFREDVLIEPAAGVIPRNIDYRRGITNRTHLFKILKFIDAKQKFVNLFVEFDTEIEGYLPEKGDLIAIPTDVIGDLSIAGEVLDYNVGTREITLSQEMLTDQAVQHAIMLREADGDVSGPFNATVSATDPTKATFDSAIPFDPSPVADRYNIIAAWGELDFSFRHFTVTRIVPRDGNNIGIEAHVYDARVYDETGSAVAPVTRPALPKVAETPDVFNIQFSNGAIPNQVVASWQADQGWLYFVVQWHDGDGFFSPPIQTTVPYWEFPIALNDVFNLTIRVRAVGMFGGAFKTATLTNAGSDDFTQPTASIAGLVDPLAGADYNLETSLTYTWTQNADVPQFYWTLEDGNGQVFTSGFTTGNSVVLSQAQIVACAEATGRIAGIIGRFDVYPSSFTQNTNFATGAGFDINNSQIGAPTTVVLSEAFNAFLVTTTISSPPNDLKGLVVYVDTSAAFTPDRDTNLHYDGEFFGVVAIPTEVAVGTTLYVQVGLYDQFGKAGITFFAEQSFIVTKNVENDQIIATQFGSGFIANPFLDQVRARSTGEILPVNWFLNGAAEGDLVYSDASKDKVDLAYSASTAQMISGAFVPNTETEYQIVLRIRANSGTPSVTFGVAEKDSAITVGKTAVSQLAAGGFIDPEIDVSVDRLLSTNQAQTTAFKIETFTYNPTITAEHASLVIQADTGESFEIDYCYLRDLSSTGATAGINLKNEAGDILADIDVRNDQLVTAAMGFLNANPTFEAFRRKSAGNGAGVRLVPVDWFVWGTTTDGVQYLDDDVRDILTLAAVTGASISSGARRVEHGTTYEFACLARVQSGTADVELRAQEYDTGTLPTGKRAIGGANAQNELEVQDRTRQIIPTPTNVGTSFTLVTAIYTPTSTAEWFSMGVLHTDDTAILEIEWAGYRDMSTLGATWLGDITNQPRTIGPNLILDPNFIQTLALGSTPEFNGAFWSESVGTLWSLQATQSEDSGPCIRLDTGGSGQHIMSTPSGIKRMPALDNDVFYCRIRIYKDAAYDGVGSDFRMEASAYDSDGGSLSHFPDFFDSDDLVNGWQTIIAQVTVTHNDTRLVTFQFVANSDPTAGFLRISHVEVTRMELDSTSGAPLGTVVGDVLADNVSDTIDGSASLSAGTQVDDGGGEYRRASHGVGIDYADDGDAHTFPEQWGEVPIVQPLAAGGLTFKNSGLTGDQTLNLIALLKTVSGFTMLAEICETAGAPTARQDTIESVPSVPSGEDRSINKILAAEAWDDKYILQFDVTVANQFIEPIQTWIPGTISIGLYANDGGGWVLYDTAVISGSPATSSTTVKNNNRATITVDGLGAGHDWAVSKDGDLFGGSTLDNFDLVDYEEASAGTSVTASPTGAFKIPFLVIG